MFNTKKNLNKKLRLESFINDLTTLSLLIEQDADIHANNDEALILSAENGHLQIVKYLIEQGADIYAWNDEALKWIATSNNLAHPKFEILHYFILLRLTSSSFRARM
jgi:hypothetical protein